MTDKNRNEIIAYNIKSLIKKNNITQKKLADSIGISPSTLSDYMNLRSNPSHGVIQKIADYFNVMKSDIDSTYKESPTSAVLSKINDTSAKLEERRQKKVLSYAEKQLHEQKNIEELNAKLDTASDELIKEYGIDTYKNIMKIVKSSSLKDSDSSSSVV